MDAARATLMLLGLVVHAGSLAASFQTITNAGPDDIAIGLSIFAHNFRMPAFFLVSGILAGLLIAKRGVAGFWLQRRRRLLYPLIAATVTIVPLTYWVENIQVSGPADLFTAGFGHLWFIEYLLLFSLTLMLIFQIPAVRRAGNKDAPKRDLGIWIVNPGSIGLLIALTFFIPDWFGAESSALTPSSALFPPIGLFLFYLVFFLFGTVICRYIFSALKWMRRFALSYLAIGVIAFAYYASFIWGGVNQEFSKLAYVTSTWMLSMAIIAIALILAKRENRLVKYLSDASYWVYLIHLPIMVALQRWFAQLHLGVALSFWISLPLVFGISIGLYHLMVRDRFIGNLLAGKL